VNETNHAEGTIPADMNPQGGADASAALAAAEARATENRNSYLRAVAELENFRKRSEREVENARKFAIERFAQELVTVGDALEAGSMPVRRLPVRPCWKEPKPHCGSCTALSTRVGSRSSTLWASPSIRSGMRP